MLPVFSPHSICCRTLRKRRYFFFPLEVLRNVSPPRWCFLTVRRLLLSGSVPPSHLSQVKQETPFPSDSPFLLFHSLAAIISPNSLPFAPRICRRILHCLPPPLPAQHGHFPKVGWGFLLTQRSFYVPSWCINAPPGVSPPCSVPFLAKVASSSTEVSFFPRSLILSSKARYTAVFTLRREIQLTWAPGAFDRPPLLACIFSVYFFRMRIFLHKARIFFAPMITAHVLFPPESEFFFRYLPFPLIEKFYGM